jgi:hypothetical protein
MLKEFWKQQDTNIKLFGFITTIAALFLNISTPENASAKLALANIQILLLVVLLISLTSLFIAFIKLLIKTEKDMQGRYDLPTVGVFSLTLALIFIWILANLLSYMTSVYPSTFAQFLSLTFPGIAVMLCFFLLVKIEKYQHNFTVLSKIIINSSVIAFLGTISGAYIQQGVIKYFYMYWFSVVLPCLFFTSFIALLVVSLYKKKELFGSEK